MLLAGFLLKYSQRGEIVLHLLEGGERRLTITRDNRIVICRGSLGYCPAPSSVKQSLRHRRSHSPEAAGPVKPIENRRSFQACHSADGQRWEKRRPCDSDLFIRR